jgi:preprotein translocase SecE subunit
MANFISEASNELEHVVWPTPTENKKYMMYTIGVIVIIGAFLAVLGFFVTNGLSLARGQFSDFHAQLPTVSGEDSMSQAELDKLLKNIQVQTGSVATGATTGTGK